jgi:hypothetical protein
MSQRGGSILDNHPVTGNRATQDQTPEHVGAEPGLMTVPARQARALEDAAHRPWPLPGRPWSQAQTRSDVLFVHWPVELDELARLLPPELAADTCAGEAWLGISAYRVESLRVRGLPPLPGLGSFPQVEVRTYVTLDDRPGTWLFSIELGSALLVEAAKRAHRLPAYRAQIEMTGERPTGLRTESRRDGLVFRAAYRPSGDPATAGAGSFEQFVAERYALYTADGGRLYRAEVHHLPWRLQPADATVEEATIAPFAVDGEPIAHFAATQDLLVWPLEKLG